MQLVAQRTARTMIRWCAVRGELRGELERVWRAEVGAARAARGSGDRSALWRHLGRAHVVSQPLAGLHVRTHALMLVQGVRERRSREVIGQVLRLAVAGPASLAGRYPLGNTGGADVRATVPMPIPGDLAPVLGRVALARRATASER